MTQQEAIAVLQEFYDYNKTLTPHGESWLQADITINRETQRNLAEALPLAIEAMSRLLTDPATGLKGCLFCKAMDDYKALQIDPAFAYEYTAAIVSRLYKVGNPHSRATSTNYGHGKFALNYCPVCGRRIGVEG